MTIFGNLSRAFTGRPPKIPAGAVVRLAPVLAMNGGLGGVVVSQLPYWTMLNNDGQEVGDRHFVCRQGHADLTYAEAYCAWVQGQGSTSAPQFPVSSV